MQLELVGDKGRFDFINVVINLISVKNMNVRSSVEWEKYENCFSKLFIEYDKM